MMSKELTLLIPLLMASVANAADLPPDPGHEIPASGRRETVISRNSPLPKAPDHALPEGYTLTVAAASPLVMHPIMGCVDDRGRLFIGDAVGVNWNKAQLEANPPNRVLMLEDTNQDGHYDKSTVFADKMTFPQGAAWLNGSLYVGSPPGIWKLTDTNADGVADQREMIVSGFDYTGNAADVHGPKLHPNGRLYWCHGRKGHAATGKDGNVVREGKASGIWSCKPDGSDVLWHSLGCADNPTGIAFTPQGDIVGTCNLYYSNPRGDTLMHWLYGGVYERADQMQAIADLPRTLETMPIIHNFGHVAVSGCTFGSAGKSLPTSALSLFVTHFNTQRLVRMELTPTGATFRAVENEFLKIQDPDVHLTDVIEDRDGSLIVLNTGGWFRIGCPSSLMAKPDMLGSVYRIRPAKSQKLETVEMDWKPDWQLTTEDEILRQLQSENPRALLHALTAAARMTSQTPAFRPVLSQLLAKPLEPVLEHAVMNAAMQSSWIGLDTVREAKDPILLRRLLQIVDQQPEDAAKTNLNLGLAADHLDSEDADLARVALHVVTKHPDADEWVAPKLQSWLGDREISSQRLQALSGFCTALIEKPETQKLITAMLAKTSVSQRQVALRVLSRQAIAKVNPDWLPLLEPKNDDGLPLLLAALKRLKTHPYDVQLQVLADDSKLPLSLRLKALDAMKGLKITEPTFHLLLSVLIGGDSSAAARIQAATMLATVPLKSEQVRELAPALATVGPVEMKELIILARKTKDAEIARVLAVELAKNPALISQQESLYRTAFSSQPPEIFETILLPARQRAEEVMDAKKRQLGPLADAVTTRGRVKEGVKNFSLGKGTCIACHQIGGVGRSIGPNLSKIGAIRTERDLLESILFPSNTLARDYEAHVIEMQDGQTVMGVIRSHTAEGLLLMDVAGQEKNLPHGQIVSNTTLTTSLMPMGLDTTLTEQELLDLVAYLRSLK
ncbi:MAG: c-type cytochrome [Prosthecobacter sp.]|nr:c-type cytochrome [Prosthecobacter sp.]